MFEWPIEKAAALKPLFTYTHLSLVDSFLDGYMGRAWVDDAENPRCAQIIVADFGFVAGDATAPGAAALAVHVPEDSRYHGILVAPQNETWAALITAQSTPKVLPLERYAFLHENHFDVSLLHQYAAALPAGYTLRPIDESLYHRCIGSPFHDLCGQFVPYANFAARGVGFCALYGEEIAAGASSYSVFNGGIEIEVDTAKAHRRKGLATACSAQLILTCFERGLYPSWDAANLPSKALAEKLGYRFSHAYKVYAVLADNADVSSLGGP